MHGHENETTRRDRVIAAAIDAAAQHTVQVCYGEYGEPRACGTGVLLRIGSQVFLASAAHVFTRARQEKLALYATGGGRGKPEQLDLRRRCVHTWDDPYDICVVELHESDCSELVRLRPAHLGDLGLEDRQASSNLYVMFGFPERAFHVDPDARLVRSNAWQFVSPACRSLDVIRGIDPAIHVTLMWYPGANAGDYYADEFVPPEGMSGSGIWRIPQQGEHPARPYLIGLITKARAEEKLFLGTRIDHVLKVIHERYPRLRSALDLYLPRPR